MSENEIVRTIADKRAEMQSAGKIHRRDLKRYIHRLEVELITYRSYQRRAKQCQSNRRAIPQ